MSEEFVNEIKKIIFRIFLFGLHMLLRSSYYFFLFMSFPLLYLDVLCIFVYICLLSVYFQQYKWPLSPSLVEIIFT